MNDLNINSIKECDIRSISKIISKIENEYDDSILSDIFTLTGKAYKIGITGGIASGKTTASNYLKNKKNVFVFNADKESKKYLIESEKIVNFLIKNKKLSKINFFREKDMNNNQLAIFKKWGVQ